jgi:hypothetical protein
MNAGLLGIGVSFATTTVIFTGVKNLTGKPRPNFLERCQPDLNNIAAHTVGGFGQSFSPLWAMVDVEICQQPDKRWLNDGFRSFPSGYTSGEPAYVDLQRRPSNLMSSRVCGPMVSVTLAECQIQRTHPISKHQAGADTKR